eukprot:jgi/Tetstr1/447826/TSEL_035154.t1
MLHDTIDRLPAMQQMTLRVAAVMGAANISAFVLAAIHPIATLASDVVSDLNSLVTAGILKTCHLPLNHFSLGTPSDYLGLSWSQQRHQDDCLSAAQSGEAGSSYADHLRLYGAAKVTYMFTTEEMRDTMLNAIPFDFRGDLHAQLALVLTRFHADSACGDDDFRSPNKLEHPDIPAATIAYHWETSSITAVGNQRCFRLKQAVKWWSQAGRQALEQGQHKASIRAFQRAKSQAAMLGTVLEKAACDCAAVSSAEKRYFGLLEATSLHRQRIEWGADIATNLLAVGRESQAITCALEVLDQLGFQWVQAQEEEQQASAGLRCCAWRHIPEAAADTGALARLDIPFDLKYFTRPAMTTLTVLVSAACAYLDRGSSDARFRRAGEWLHKLAAASAEELSKLNWEDGVHDQIAILEYRLRTATRRYTAA